MGSRIESKQQIDQLKGEGVRKFLFFMPPELWIGNSPGENHENILAESGKEKENVAVAGLIGYLFDNFQIRGGGSSSLEIGPHNTKPVVEFVESLT